MTFDPVARPGSISSGGSSSTDRQRLPQSMCVMKCYRTMWPKLAECFLFSVLPSALLRATLFTVQLFQRVYLLQSNVKLGSSHNNHCHSLSHKTNHAAFACTFSLGTWGSGIALYGALRGGSLQRRIVYAAMSNKTASHGQRELGKHFRMMKIEKSFYRASKEPLRRIGKGAQHTNR